MPYLFSLSAIPRTRNKISEPKVHGFVVEDLIGASNSYTPLKALGQYGQSSILGWVGECRTDGGQRDTKNVARNFQTIRADVARRRMGGDLVA